MLPGSLLFVLGQLPAHHLLLGKHDHVEAVRRSGRPGSYRRRIFAGALNPTRDILTSERTSWVFASQPSRSAAVSCWCFWMQANIRRPWR